MLLKSMKPFIKSCPFYKMADLVKCDWVHKYLCGFFFQVPNIGVIGSGGGFRAMTAYSGVFTALVDSHILDMTTYVGGLSGSAW